MLLAGLRRLWATLDAWADPRAARLNAELALHRRWWESYDHDTPLQKVSALGDACSYWHSCWETAMEEVEELREQVSWTVARCDEAMGDGFRGTRNSSVAAVCDELKRLREDK